MPIGIWSAVETHVGVIVACLPAIRSLQRSIRDRLFPKPATSTTFYEDDTTKVSSKKRSHRSRLSTLVRSKMDEDDFKLLDEYEMKGAGVTGSTPVEEDIIHSHSHGSSLNRSFGSKDDIRPLGTSPARPEGVLGGIVVQKEYSVDRGSLQPR